VGCSERCPQFRKVIPLHLDTSQAGYANAIQELVRIYFLGLGVTTDRQKGLSFIIMAAALGLIKSQWALAQRYREGSTINVVPVLVLEWFVKVAQKKDMRA
jgi:TPR repeat protein